MDPEIPVELQEKVDRIIARRIKEHDAEGWARGINGSITRHSEAIETLTKDVGKLSRTIADFIETAPARAQEQARQFGLDPSRAPLLRKLLDREARNEIRTGDAERRVRWFDRWWVRIAVGVAILYQLVGVDLGLVGPHGLLHLGR